MVAAAAVNTSQNICSYLFSHSWISSLNNNVNIFFVRLRVEKGIVDVNEWKWSAWLPPSRAPGRYRGVRNVVRYNRQWLPLVLWKPTSLDPLVGRQSTIERNTVKILIFNSRARCSLVIKCLCWLTGIGENDKIQWDNFGSDLFDVQKIFSLNKTHIFAMAATTIKNMTKILGNIFVRHFKCPLTWLTE